MIIPLTLTLLCSAFAFSSSGAFRKHLRLVGTIASYIFLFLMQVLFVLEFLTHTWRGLATMESVQENIKSLEFINGCGDEYTVV